jgi:tetratricopeptide (TPR) repeat protein
MIKLLGENHGDVAEIYNNIAVSFSNLDDHKQSLEYYQKSFAIRIKIFGENHVDVANSYHYIGLSYGNLGDHKQSLEYY